MSEDIEGSGMNIMDIGDIKGVYGVMGPLHLILSPNYPLEEAPQYTYICWHLAASTWSALSWFKLVQQPQLCRVIHDTSGRCHSVVGKSAQNQTALLAVYSSFSAHVKK